MNNEYQNGRGYSNHSGQDYSYQGNNNNRNNNNTSHSFNNNHTNYPSNNSPRAVQIQQQNRYPLNRDFHEVLERGSLEDVARLLESTAPKPEVFTTNHNNNLYFVIIVVMECFIYTIYIYNKGCISISKKSSLRCNCYYPPS